ncbi:hypothetical protein SNL152K_1805 [Streptomyces sp. NL15-2K]|nr:hypothetical protein SNL152K_1805 [Streptomyces sp. NL15-2K]
MLGVRGHTGQSSNRIGLSDFALRSPKEIRIGLSGSRNG